MTNQSIQVDESFKQPKQAFPIIMNNRNEEQCGDIIYSFGGLPEGITLNEEGFITIETGKVIPKTEIQITLIVGHQTIQTPGLTFEVYDCFEKIV